MLRQGMMAIALLLALGASDALARTWNSANGAFKIEAELIEKRPDGTVILKRADGTSVETKAEKLSKDDQDYIRKWTPGADADERPAQEGEDPKDVPEKPGSALNPEAVAAIGKIKSAEVKAAVQAYEETEKQLSAAQVAKQKEYREKLADMLEVALKEATTAGNLDDALAIRDTIKALKSGAEPLMLAGQSRPATEPETKEAAKPAAVIMHQIVLWNVHNAQFGDSGTETCNVILFRGEDEVWRQNEIKLPWGGPKDPSLALKPPVMDYDRIRIEITKFRGQRGGLSEVSLTHGGRNLLRQGKFARKIAVTASASFAPQANESCILDGILSSVQHLTGYWLLPDGKTGWLEIRLPDNLATILK